jgi:HlyD family secretion protein
MLPFFFLKMKTNIHNTPLKTRPIFILFQICLLCITSCSTPTKTYRVVKSTITESVYASGNIESTNQYQLFSSVNGVIDSIYVSEGELVKKGEKILKISNEIAQLSLENSSLQMNFNRLDNNKNKLKELQLSIEVAATKNRFDSIQFRKNKLLYENEIITSTELNNSELVAKNSKTNWNNLKMQLEDLKKQLHLNEQLSKTTFSQTRKNNADYLLKSEINGEIFTLLKKKGELITPQTLIGLMGDKNSYKLKLQIDEYDIVKVKLGQAIIVKLDSYKGKIFQAKVTKIIPYMNERSKTFIVEGTFVTPPPTLYPNLSFEATILIHKKENALIIPRELLIDDQFVIDNRGNKKKVTTGLKDYTSIEILSGIKENEILNYPDEK